MVRTLLPGERVELAFLEFAEPSLEGLVEGLLGQDSRAGGWPVLIVPVFLSGGGDVAADLPGLVEMLCERFPGVRFETTGALGEDPQVLSAMAAAVAGLACSRPGSRASSRS